MTSLILSLCGHWPMISGNSLKSLSYGDAWLMLRFIEVKSDRPLNWDVLDTDFSLPRKGKRLSRIPVVQDNINGFALVGKSALKMTNSAE